MDDSVSIIVVNYNGIKYLKACLDSIRQVDYKNYEVIVVDNGSKDGSQYFANVHIGANKGLAYASNLGALHAKGKYLFFLNNDTKVDKNILRQLVNHYQEGIGILGCTMFDYDGQNIYDSFLSVDKFGYPCGTTGEMFYADGAIFIKKSLFDEIGGFDEKLFLYGEDRDLCWRVSLQRLLVAPCTFAIFNHASTSVTTGSYNRRYHGEKNLIRSMLKNYSWRSLCVLLPQYAVLSLAEILLLTCMGRGKAVLKSYIPAYMWNITNLADTLKERRKVQRHRKVNDKYIRNIMSSEIGKLFVLRTMGVPKFKEIVR